MNRVRTVDEACGIAQAAAVVGDWWNLLVLREVARGHRRFDALAAELGISRKVLTQRLNHLVEHGVLERSPYQQAPVRHDYLLTERGQALLPVLVSMQDWADRWLLGDGSLTATTSSESADAARMASLVGSVVPRVELPCADGAARDVVASGMTVLFTYPATGRPTPLPSGWYDIPGTAGCTLENRLFRDRWPSFVDAGVAVHGVSTQRPDEQAAFAASESVPYPLLSDVDLALVAALRLPTFRAAQQLRLKRLILVVDGSRVVRHVLYPVLDIPAAVEQSLALARG